MFSYYADLHRWKQEVTKYKPRSIYRNTYSFKSNMSGEMNIYISDIFFMFLQLHDQSRSKLFPTFLHVPPENVHSKILWPDARTQIVHFCWIPPVDTDSH